MYNGFRPLRNRTIKKLTLNLLSLYSGKEAKKLRLSQAQAKKFVRS